MKQIILFLFLIMTLATQAQTIKIEPKTVAVDFKNQNLSDYTLQLQQYAKVTNLTKQEIRLRWTRVVIDQPLDWETQVCDNNACYIPRVSTNIDAAVGFSQPVVLKPDSSFNLGLYIVPNGVAGRGSFQLVLALASSPNTPIDTVTFNTSVNQATTSTQDVAVSDIRVFPNPASDYFELTNDQSVERLMVYNLLGREVRSFRTQGIGQQYSLQGLPDGLYLIALVNDRKEVIKTVRLNKRSFRP
ncbi:MAG: T9SS type A sorting domain-containing protein [Saprospiraceae bacterium]